MTGIYKSGSYSRLATDIVQWCAFLHKTEHNNELQKTDCSSVALFSPRKKEAESIGMSLIIIKRKITNCKRR